MFDIWKDEGMNVLPDILSVKDIFFVATHPYAEDVQVEPKSLYGFMLPIFTDFFVDQKATGKYSGGYFAENFKDYELKKSEYKEVRALSYFAINPLIRGKIGELLTVMHDINDGATDDDDFMFAILPLAYATMAMDDLSEVIKDPKKGINISATIKRDLKFVLGEA